MGNFIHPFRHETPGEILRGFIHLAAHILLFLFFLRTFSVQTAAIPSRSMEDQLMVGDHVLVDMVCFRSKKTVVERILFPPHRLHRGDIIAFHPPGSEDQVFIKRVIGLPGDQIRIQSGQVWVNNMALNENYLNRDIVTKPRCRSPLFTIPPKHVFCLGDNRSISNDSRSWGPLPIENILGKPWRIYWSFQSTPESYSASGFLQQIQRLFHYAAGFFDKTRWGRTCRRIQPHDHQGIPAERINLKTSTAITKSEK